MTFTESIQTCFRKSFTLKGTASRSEYWYFALFILLTSFTWTILLFVVVASIGYHYSETANLLGFGALGIFNLCMLPAFICATVRRLHDIGKPGIYSFVCLITYVGLAILLYYLVQPTKEDSPYKEKNNYFL